MENPKHGVASLSKEKLLQVLSKKKECNNRALKIVKQSIEENVDEKWLLMNLKHINKCHFEDIVEERTISGLCGYPLCDSSLVNVLRQTYKISTLVNKVYDITKRKKYCSNSCYKASRFLIDQLPTSPLWLRDCESPVEFKSHNKSTSKTCNNVKTSFGSTDTNIKDGAFDSIKFSTMSIPSLDDETSSNIKNQTVEPLRVIDKKTIDSNNFEYFVTQWFTPETSAFVVQRKNTAGNSPQNEETEIIEKRNKKLNILELQDSEMQKPLKPLPHYEKLKEEAENLQIKVHFFPSGDITSPTNEKSLTKSENLPKLPNIDHLAVLSIRQRLFLHQILKTLPDILVNLSLSHFKLNLQMQLLISTFNLSAKNIYLRKSEWILVTLLVIKLLSLCNEELCIAYFSEDTQTRLKSYLAVYNLTENYFDKLIHNLITCK